MTYIDGLWWQEGGSYFACTSSGSSYDVAIGTVASSPPQLLYQVTEEGILTFLPQDTPYFSLNTYELSMAGGYPSYHYRGVGIAALPTGSLRPFFYPGNDQAGIREWRYMP